MKALELIELINDISHLTQSICAVLHTQPIEVQMILSSSPSDSRSLTPTSGHFKLGDLGTISYRYSLCQKKHTFNSNSELNVHFL